MQGNDLHQRTRRITTLNIQRSACLRHTEDEAAWTISVVWIVFDHFTLGNRLP
jgi:hypothetical protein